MATLKALLAGAVVLTALAVSAYLYYRSPPVSSSQVKEALEANQPEQALELLRQFPEHDQSRALRGLAWLAMGKPNLAESELAQITPQGQTSDDAQLLLGRLLHARGDNAAAGKVLDELGARATGDVFTLRWLAAVFYDMGELTKSARFAEKVAQLAPDDPRPCRLLGLIAQRRAEPAVAWKHYQQAIDRGAVDPATLHEAAAVAMELNQFPEALSVLHRSTSSDAKTLGMRGGCLLALGDQAGAQAAIDKALSLDPDQFDALFGQGSLLIQTGKLDEAAAVLEQAVEQDPLHWAARDKLALVYGRLHRSKEADEQRARASELRQSILHRVWPASGQTPKAAPAGPSPK